jgi:predicted Zn-ribbon and HTH transcriptional regulator
MQKLQKLISKIEHRQSKVAETDAPNPERCEKCLAEFEQDRPQTYAECPHRGSEDCPVGRSISLRSFA